MSNIRKELTVCVVSGPTLSGKSHLLNWLRSLPEYRNTTLIEMDKIRLSIFGNRKLTDTEHVFKNEATLHALKTKLITDRPKIVFLEMGLPTETKHQKPLLATIADAQRYIDAIETEASQRQLNCSPKINLKVILNYCDEETVKRRISYRLSRPDLDSSTNVFDIETWLRDMSLLFEVPQIYQPLPINTSDESESIVQEYRQEVLSFINGSWPINKALWPTRMNEFKNLINQARKISGISRGNSETNQTKGLFERVKLLALDCDGVMTDGTTLVGTATLGSDLQKMTGATGIELSRFNHRDGAGIHALIESGVPVIMITSQKSEYVAVRGEKLFQANGRDSKKFAYFYKVEDKPECLLEYLKTHHPEITPDQVCFVGDDLGDIPIMKMVGLPVAVKDARPEVKELARYITKKTGGNEAVREVCDLIIQAQK